MKHKKLIDKTENLLNTIANQGDQSGNIKAFLCPSFENNCFTAEELAGLASAIYKRKKNFEILYVADDSKKEEQWRSKNKKIIKILTRLGHPPKPINEFRSKLDWKEAEAALNGFLSSSWDEFKTRYLSSEKMKDSIRYKSFFGLLSSKKVELSDEAKAKESFEQAQKSINDAIKFNAEIFYNHHQGEGYTLDSCVSHVTREAVDILNTMFREGESTPGAIKTRIFYKGTQNTMSREIVRLAGLMGYLERGFCFHQIKFKPEIIDEHRHTLFPSMPINVPHGRRDRSGSSSGSRSSNNSPTKGELMKPEDRELLSTLFRAAVEDEMSEETTAGYIVALRDKLLHRATEETTDTSERQHSPKKKTMDTSSSTTPRIQTRRKSTEIIQTALAEAESKASNKEIPKEAKESTRRNSPSENENRKDSKRISPKKSKSHRSRANESSKPTAHESSPPIPAIAAQSQRDMAGALWPTAKVPPKQNTSPLHANVTDKQMLPG